jgi:uncharacterized protein
MPEDLLEKYFIQHISISTEPEIFFSWHGGEPTLAGLNFFRQAVALQKKHLPKNKRIINGIQTNGTLLNQQWCQFLKNENFIVGISLDGPERFHSLNRSGKNGKSSFPEVIRGLEFLKKYEIPFEILCVVSAGNVKFPLEVYRFLKKTGASFITFLPLVEQVNGSFSGQTVPPKAFGEFLIAIFEEWKDSDIGQTKIQIIEEALRSAFNLEHSLCIFKKTCGRVPVVENNGDFYSCDHYVDPVHLIGNIQTMSLAELLDHPKQMNFGRNKWDALPDYCLNCEVLDRCNGACPKDRVIQTPDGQAGLNYLCEGYKLFFNHIRPFSEIVAQIWREQQ